MTFDVEAIESGRQTKPTAPLLRLTISKEPTTESGIPFSVEKAMMMDGVQDWWTDKPWLPEGRFGPVQITPELPAPLELERGFRLDENHSLLEE